MWRPEESLDDFIVKADTELTKEPPRAVSLRFTGEVEVLKPLARWERPAKPVQAIVEFEPRPAVHSLSWFHRSLVAGGGLALITLILASAIFIGISDPPSQPDVDLADNDAASSELATEGQTDTRQMPAEEPLSSDIFTTASSQPSATTSLKTKKVFRSNRSSHSAFKTSTRPRVQFAAYRPRRQARGPQFLVSTFVPTTLVIYIENGQIKTRTEPWLAAGDKKTRSN